MLNSYLLIAQYFDWLAAFRLELLQAILSIAVLMSGAVILANCFEVFPLHFSQILPLQGCLLQTRYT